MNNEIKIESDVPIPARCGRPNILSDVLKAMKVGDSFVFPFDKRATAHSAATYCRVKIATRKVDKEHIRVWRIA